MSSKTHFLEKWETVEGIVLDNAAHLVFIHQDIHKVVTSRRACRAVEMHHKLVEYVPVSCRDLCEFNLRDIRQALLKFIRLRNERVVDFV